MYLKAEKGKGNTVIYYTSNGIRTIRKDGSRACRNNNPGNVIAGRFSNDHGAIGSAGGFAVFPDYQTGRSAFIALIKGSKYFPLTIHIALGKYEPRNADNYRTLVKQFTGLESDRTIQSLNATEFDSLIQAIEKIEGWILGTETTQPPLKQIMGTKKDKTGFVIEYHINGLGWIPKAEAIDLARKGEVDAVLAQSKNGNPYLRSHPDHSITNNFIVHTIEESA